MSPSPDQQVGGTMWAVWTILGLSSLVELILIAGDFGLIGTTRWRSLAYQNGGFWIGLLQNWRPNYPAQPYLMFASYAFLHAGFTHLAVNMLTLVSLAKLIIPRIGQLRFVVLYVLSMLGGAAGFAILSDSIQPMIGASGALFGLAGAIAAWEYIDRFTARLRLWPVARLILLLVVLNIVLWWAMDGQLAWQTHLGGFIIGWIVALLIDPRSRPIPRQ